MRNNDVWCRTGVNPRKVFIIPVGKASDKKAKKAIEELMAKFKEKPLPHDIMIVKKEE